MAMGNKKEDWVVCLEGFSERSKAWLDLRFYIRVIARNLLQL
jgi:hypothetical protein